MMRTYLKLIGMVALLFMATQTFGAPEQKLSVGDKCPEVQLKNQSGEAVLLSSFRGKKLLIYFYPRADTPGCTIQACAVRDAKDELSGFDVVRVGISPDEPDEQEKFDKKFNLGFTLLCDTEFKAAEAFGVVKEKGKKGAAQKGILRSSFLIDQEGKIIGAWYGVKPQETVPKALEALGKN